MKNECTDITSNYYPEVGINGVTSIDGTIEFYNRVNSILTSSMVVLDYGAGRGAWYEDDVSSFRKNTRFIKGKVKRVIGCDIDEGISNNKSLDESILFKFDEPLPFEDETIDIIISDYTFEHVTDPCLVANEFNRVLKKGGWICARTPNKYSYISIITRLIKNKYHSKVLKFAQPSRKEVDVFPTKFKLNTLASISMYFDKKKFVNYTYRYEPEPSYHFNIKLIFITMLFFNKYLPSFMKSNLFIFLKKI